MKILIGEDQEATRQMYMLMLADYDVRVVEAWNGRSVLERAEADRPDLIILDNKMPEMTGYEVVHKLKESAELARIPILFITGSSVDDTMRDMIKLEVSEFLPKPVTVAELIGAIERILKKALPPRT